MHAHNGPFNRQTHTEEEPRESYPTQTESGAGAVIAFSCIPPGDTDSVDSPNTKSHDDPAKSPGSRRETGGGKGLLR